MNKPLAKKKTRNEWAEEFACWRISNLSGLAADLVMESQELRMELQVLRMQRARLLKIAESYKNLQAAAASERSGS